MRHWNLLLTMRAGVPVTFLPAESMVVFCCLGVGLAGLLLLGLPRVFLFSLWSGVRVGLPGACPWDLGDWGTFLTRCISNWGMSSGSLTASSWCQGVLLPPGWISFGLDLRIKSFSPKLTLVAVLKWLSFLISNAIFSIAEYLLNSSIGMYFSTLGRLSFYPFLINWANDITKLTISTCSYST